MKIINEPPPNWLKTIENIRKVRQKFPAPVDTMGCDQAHTKTDKEVDQRFHVLVSLMLSSQTKDPITWKAVQKLKEKGMGNVDGILNANEKDIEETIYPVGFYRRKAIYLKKVAQILKNKYNGDIPRSIKDLCDLPGVGPKMAHLCMLEAWDELSGIGVDTHVHRISARLGWVPNKGIKTPEDTRKFLESWLPQDYWRGINHLLVGFGQTICTPVRPKCEQCYNNVICPSSSVKSTSKNPEATEETGTVKVHKSPKISQSPEMYHLPHQKLKQKKTFPKIKLEKTSTDDPPKTSQATKARPKVKLEKTSPKVKLEKSSPHGPPKRATRSMNKAS